MNRSRNSTPKKAVIITGPTASGKTALAHRLFTPNDIIINADSMQIYKYMDIGTAKPCHTDIKKYNYQLIDFIEPGDNYSAYEFYKNACDIIYNSDTGQRIYISGGTPLFINILKTGIFNLPEASTGNYKEYYNSIHHQKGLEYLLSLLEEADPEYYAEVDRKNPRRVIRALESIKQSGMKFSELRQKTSPPEGISFLTLLLQVDRNLLYDRINLRVDNMIKMGLEAEVKGLLEKGIPSSAQAMQGIGYKEIIMHINNNCTLDEAVLLIKKRTRNFSKRQLTWFRKEKKACILDADHIDHTALHKQIEDFYEV